LVLAGGAGRRMGRDKALLPFGDSGLTLAGWAAERLAAVCPEVALADGGRGLLTGRPSLPDGAGAGPAAGLLGAAAVYPGRPVLALAVDLPEIPVELLAELAASPAHDWAVPAWEGHLEPLCAFYRPAALAALAAAVERGQLALHRLADEPGLRVRRLGPELLARFGPPERLFVNLNTPEDVVRWRGRT
jgi:molybdopterin-guanine dinucleotide biosynthesis protein A